jgi:glycopeptide antibiotics resistance protein
LVAALLLVARVTLTPEGSGWAWGSPTTELRWYVTGLDSPNTVVQLLGNLLLLAPLSVLAVLRWPALGRFVPLAGAGLSTGTAIELLQRLLPLGRVVSPVDAVLNTAGAVAAGLAMAQAARSLTARQVRATA